MVYTQVIHGWKKFCTGLPYQVQPACLSKRQAFQKINRRVNRTIQKIKIELMCNCGNKRDNYAQQSYKLSNDVVSEPGTKKRWADIHFEYTGHSGLTVTGSVTGKRYRFNFPGEILVIDYRDASAMRSVPVLKSVKTATGL